MSAERLRQAARVLRERADGVRSIDMAYPETTGGPDSNYTPVFLANAIGGHVSVDLAAPGCGRAIDASAELLSLMTPGVGLALADWLDDVARWLVFGDPGGHRNVAHALAVADQILGSAS